MTYQGKGAATVLIGEGTTVSARYVGLFERVRALDAKSKACTITREEQAEWAELSVAVVEATRAMAVETAKRLAANYSTYLAASFGFETASEAWKLAEPKRLAGRPSKGSEARSAEQGRAHDQVLATFYEVFAQSTGDRTFTGAARCYYGTRGGHSEGAVEQAMRRAVEAQRAPDHNK